ncbi:MAG: MFS transporter [Holosporales bacterium]|nr:MFS transporter [Holosporales bacterium]
MSTKKAGGFFFDRSIPRGILAIGIASLFINIATVVTFSGSSLYMKTVLGTGVAVIGLLEAVIEIVAYTTRIFSGVISDFFKNRKVGIVIGFALIAISKPLLAFSKTVPHIFITRLMDRAGNGIQASPRDAFVGDIAPPHLKGSCYGFRQSLCAIGSTIGGIMGIVILSMSNNNFELLFLIAGIPAVLAVLVITLFTKEKKDNHQKSKLNRQPIKIKNLKLLGNKFWLLMIVVLVFMMSRFSEIFIVLHACGNHGLSISYGPSISVIFNLVAALIAFPIGKISDKIERTTLLLIGLIMLFSAHLLIYSSSSLYGIFLGLVIWGSQFGINQAIVSVLVSDYVPKGLRGTGFGVYYVITAIATGFASFFAGIMSAKTGSEVTAFFYGAIFSGISIILLLFLKGRLKLNK